MFHKGLHWITDKKHVIMHDRHRIEYEFLTLQATLFYYFYYLLQPSNPLFSMEQAFSALQKQISKSSRYVKTEYTDRYWEHRGIHP